jgi:hypothetical protein
MPLTKTDIMYTPIIALDECTIVTTHKVEVMSIPRTTPIANIETRNDLRWRQNIRASLLHLEKFRKVRF